MNRKTFIKFLLGAIVLSITAHSVINMVIPVFKYLDFTLMCIGLFSGICILFYWLGTTSSKSKDKNFFIYIILFNVFVKLIAAFALVALYIKLRSPGDKYFVVPFLFIYFIFTLFETYFLSLQAKTSA